MAEMKEQMAAASTAHKEALEASEAQLADARKLAELYEQQVEELTSQLQSGQHAASAEGGAAAAGTPITPGAMGQLARTGPSTGPRLMATAADLLAQSPSSALEGLQAQGKSYADVVAMYTDMVSGVLAGRASAATRAWRRPRQTRSKTKTRPGVCRSIVWRSYVKNTTLLNTVCLTTGKATPN